MLCSLFAGCARYQYSVIEPGEFAQPIERKGEIEIMREPLEYEFVDLDERLGVRIHNTSDRALAIVGPQSYVVDPDNATHQTPDQTIAPHSYIAFTLPHTVDVYRPSSRFGIGIGVGSFSSGGSYYGGGIGRSFYDDPFYPGDYYRARATAWRWKTGDVRMHLTIQPGGGENEPTFQHEFTITRVRVD